MNNNIVVLEEGVNFLEKDEYPVLIMYEGNQYEYFDSGGSGKIYIDEKEEYILKILYSYIITYETFQHKCMDEISKQNLAALYNLSPQLEYRFIKLLNGNYICCMKMKY